MEDKSKEHHYMENMGLRPMGEKNHQPKQGMDSGGNVLKELVVDILQGVFNWSNKRAAKKRGAGK